MPYLTHGVDLTRQKNDFRHYHCADPCHTVYVWNVFHVVSYASPSFYNDDDDLKKKNDLINPGIFRALLKLSPGRWRWESANWYLNG